MNRKTGSTSRNRNHNVSQARGIPLDRESAHGGDKYDGPIQYSVVGGRGNKTTYNVTNAVTVTVFDILQPYFVEDALYDSAKREEEHAIVCQPNTRKKVIGNINGWDSRHDGRQICWLRGPAGSGKSTVAHTIAEQCKKRGQLAASFFFSRGKGDREDIHKLIPTLAVQLAQRFSSAEMLMQEALREDRSLPSKTLQQQFTKLIVEPARKMAEDNLLMTVVIDGLDECKSRHDVVKLIHLLCDSGVIRGLPLRFLITSRPEAFIQQAFRPYTAARSVYELRLEDFNTDNDIHRYLQPRFAEIRDKWDSIMEDEPRPWPSAKDLETLVEKSEGLFIYVSTLVQFLGDGLATPQSKLQKVLKAHAGVDPLYDQVISEAQKYDNFHRVIGSLMYLKHPLPINELAELIGFDVASIRAALQGCLSILFIPDGSDQPIRPYHASLRDFLVDRNRSKHLFLDPVKHHALCISDCLTVITADLESDYRARPFNYACKEWYRHCHLLLQHVNETGEAMSLSDLGMTLKKITLKWLKHWICAAVENSGGGFIVSDNVVMTAEGWPPEARDLHRRYKQIGWFLRDLKKFHDEEWVGEWVVVLPDETAHKFFNSPRSWPSVMKWKFSLVLEQLSST